MAAQTNAITTGSALNKFWRKVQGNLSKAFAHGQSPEVQLFNSLPAFEAPFSQYEVTFPLDLNERGGVAAVPDGGHLAKASSVNAVEATVAANHYNKRFAISDFSRFTDRNRANQIVRQLVAQTQQAVDAMNEDMADRMHGVESGVLATTDSDISDATPTLTLTAGYGVAGITNAKFIASKFKVGERIVLATSADALVDGTDSFGSITAVNKTNGTITLALDGSVTYSTNGIRIYKANNLEGTTMAGGSDFNKGMTGFITGLTATTVHNVSGSTHPNWTVAYSDTNAGRFTPAKLWRGIDEIENDGGVSPDTLIVSQGVRRDMIDQERAGLRYDSATSLTFDGDLRIAGVRIVSTKRVPPGYVYLGARSTVNKWDILPQTTAGGETDLLPSETLAGGYARIDRICNMVWKNRKGWAYWTAATTA